MMLVIWLLGWPLVSTYTIQQEAKLGRTYDSKKVNLAEAVEGITKVVDKVTK